MTFASVGAARASEAGDRSLLVKRWHQKGIDEALNILREDDIVVTNARDKELQLLRLAELPGSIQKIQARH